MSLHLFLITYYFSTYTMLKMFQCSFTSSYSASVHGAETMKTFFMNNAETTVLLPINLQLAFLLALLFLMGGFSS